MSVPMLRGKRYIITRPHDRGLSLSHKITNYGGEALLMPMVEIIPRSHKVDLPKNSIFVFTSVYSVELASINWPDLRDSSTEVYAIGPSTSAALAKRGISAKLPENYNSEGLIALLEKEISQGCSFTEMVIAKGHGGRELLSRWCSIKNIEYTPIIVYRRRPTVGIPDTAIDWLQKQEQRQLSVICTSVEAIELWAETMKKLTKQNPCPQPALVICSDRMAEAAKILQLPVRVIARDCHNDALFVALIDQSVA